MAGYQQRAVVGGDADLEGDREHQAPSGAGARLPRRLRLV